MSKRARGLMGTRWLGAVLLLACLGCGPAVADGSDAASISAEDLERRIQDGSAPLILDVRTPEEYAAGHIPGALLIPHDQLAGRLAELEAGQADEIVVYCRSGRRSALAEQTLVAAGYTAVRPLSGDMLGWQEGKHPVTTGASKR